MSSFAYFGWFFMLLGIGALLANSFGPFSSLWYADGPRNERGVRILIWSLFAIGVALLIAALVIG